MITLKSTISEQQEQIEALNSKFKKKIEELKAENHEARADRDMYVEECKKLTNIFNNNIQNIS